MSYTPTNWQTGDVVSAEKLNKLEQGVANSGGASVLYVNITADYSGPDPVWTADKTYAQIMAHLLNGGICYLNSYGTLLHLSSPAEEGYDITFYSLRTGEDAIYYDSVAISTYEGTDYIDVITNTIPISN